MSPDGFSPLGPLVAVSSSIVAPAGVNMAGASVRTTESCSGGAGGAALETLGKAKAVPTIAVVRISFSFMVAPLDPRPWRFLVYHSERAGSRERRFCSDSDYSDSPAASRA